jgi:hypothetical protein
MTAVATPLQTKDAYELRVLFPHTTPSSRARRHQDARHAIDVRDAIVRWANSPRNQYQLHHRDTDHAGYLYETEKGWVLNIVISYRTSTGDGDKFDVTRGVTRQLESMRSKGEIVHTRKKTVRA